MHFYFTCYYLYLSYSKETNHWNLTRSEVSKISIMMLVTRCEYILNRFLTDENDLGACLLTICWVPLMFISPSRLFLLNHPTVPAGERPLPAARLEEIIFVLQELARLIIHSDTASILPLHPHLKSGLAEEESQDKHPHLLVLFPSFCELVVSR